MFYLLCRCLSKEKLATASILLFNQQRPGYHANNKNTTNNDINTTKTPSTTSTKTTPPITITKARKITIT